MEANEKRYARTLDEVNAYLDGKHGIEYVPDDEITYLEDDCVAQFDKEGDGTVTCTVFRSVDDDEVVEEISVDPQGWEKHPESRLTA